MFRHMPIPLDGSRIAVAAVSYAITRARDLDARLSLLGERPSPDIENESVR